MGDIKKLESVQRKFTKFLSGMFNVPNSDRQERFDLESMQIRRIRAELVLIYKTVHGLTDIAYIDCFKMNERISRRHILKTNVQYYRSIVINTFLLT